MNKSLLFYLIILLLLLLLNLIVKGDSDSSDNNNDNNNNLAQSIKLSFTKYSKDSLRVTWYTNNEMQVPLVLYSTELFNAKEIIESGTSLPSNTIMMGIGRVSQYDTDGFNTYPTSAIMDNLLGSTIYYYSVGDKSNLNSWSNTLNFTTRSDIISSSSDGDSDSGDSVIPFTSSWFGDMGWITNSSSQNSDVHTIDNLELIIDKLSFVTHLGDIAYADISDDHHSNISGNETIWNRFLNSIEPVSSRIPYMTCPGNHDSFNDDLLVYKKTFQMPTIDDDDEVDHTNWYSYDYNGVHFISFSSESNYLPFSEQYSWIKNDLQSYRKSNPTGWIIMYSHRPFYCSAKFEWCKLPNHGEKTEKEIYTLALEDLLYQYNVNLFISGHMHAYQVSKPVYKSKVFGDYQSPKATVHLVIGTGGNRDGDLLQWESTPQPWETNLKTSLQGFGLLSILNSTTLLWQFIENFNNTIIDEFYLNNSQF